MINIKTSRKTLITTVFVHFFIFAALYTLPFLLGHNLFPALSIEGLHFPIERWLVWVVPCVILTIVFKDDLYISFKDMFTNKVKWKILAWCILPLMTFYIVSVLVSQYTGFGMMGKVVYFDNINEMWAKVSEDAWFSLTVPAIPEEMVFRAWIQNALIGKSPSKKRLILSFVITNILFVIIHLSYYFYRGYPLARMLTEGFCVFVMGSVFGLMFYKSKNILVPIFAHCFVDTISFSFFS